jgi:hypothetical protein
MPFPWKALLRKRAGLSALPSVLLLPLLLPLLLTVLLAAACSGEALSPPSLKPPFGPEPSEEVCKTQSKLAAKLNTSHLLMGIATSGDENRYERYIRGVPYGLKYLYLANRALRGGPCAECGNCPSNTVNWWGCWSGGRAGGHLRNLFSSSEAAGQIPMVVYYVFFATIFEHSEGAEHLAGQLANTNNVRDYFDDWRFVLEVVNEYQRQSNKPVMLHIEPDLWGYAQQSNAGRSGPENLAVDVRSAGRGDCADMENNFAGFGKCMLRMARIHAPEASVGLMASGWATGRDINRGNNQSLDAKALGESTGEYLNKLGAGEGDFLVVEFSDRDAGYYEATGQTDRWYDVNNQSVPNFHRTFLWGKTLSDTVKLPLVWWQIPMGHMQLGNTNNHWRDNRVDYLFAHLDEVAATQAIALAFGPGAGDQTSPATDGNNLANKVRDYASGAKQALACH